MLKMDLKQDISLKLVCSACLCVERSLRELRDEKLRQFYTDALKEISLYNSPIQNPLFCWECRALLQKAVSFREQVKDSYRILQAYTNESLHEYLLTDVTRAPRLKITKNKHINIKSCKSSIETECIYVKDELKCESDEDDGDYDDLSPIDEASPEPKEECLNIKPIRPKKKEKSLINLESKAKSIKVEILDSGIPKTNYEKPHWDADIDAKEHDASRDPGTDIDGEIKQLIDGIIEKKHKRLKNKIPSVKKIGRSNEKSKIKKSKEKKQILTIELTYEEMLLEREKESTKDSYVKALYKCESCLIGFNYNKSFLTHITNKHSSNLGDYSCPICKTVVASVDSFTAHYKRHMRRYECGVCHKRGADLRALQQHCSARHRLRLRSYRCAHCPHVADTIDSHRYHAASHKPRVQCADCDKTFRHRAGLMNHRLTVHELQNEFPCAVCDKVFRWKTSLKRHQEKHNAQAKSNAAAYCEECSVSFSSVCSYQRHLKNSLKHVSHDQLKFICDHCNRRFADKTKLRDHIEEKHLHKTYQCPICLKPSKNRVSLDQHTRNVHRGRPHNKVCHHCGKAFPTKVQLESHIRTHTGERPFICEFCPTTFSQQSNLYKHYRQVHLNIKSKRYPQYKKRKEDKDPPGPPIPGDTFRAPLLVHFDPHQDFLG